MGRQNLSEETLARRRLYERMQYHKRKQDPEWLENRRKLKRDAKRLRRCDPEWREKTNEAQRLHRKQNKEMYKAYERNFYERKGISRTEARKQWRTNHPEEYRQQNAKWNDRRFVHLVAEFRRGNVSFDEFSRRLSEMYVFGAGRDKG